MKFGEVAHVSAGAELVGRKVLEAGRSESEVRWKIQCGESGRSRKRDAVEAASRKATY